MLGNHKFNVLICDDVNNIFTLNYFVGHVHGD
jgi:hypothetical protein